MRIDSCLNAGVEFVLSHPCARMPAHGWGTAPFCQSRDFFETQERTGRRWA
jgi:hypothetical protein